MIYRIWGMRVGKLLTVSFKTSDEAYAHVRFMVENGPEKDGLIIIPTLN